MSNLKKNIQNNKEPVRVLHVLHGLNCGGAETMVMNYYRNIDRNKIQFDFLIHTNKKCFYDDEIISLGGRIFRAPYYCIYNSFKYKKFLNQFFSSHPEIKIVHGHLSSCWHIYLKIAKKYGCYTIAHAHIAHYQHSIKNIIKNFYALRVRYIADYFFGCGKEALIFKFGNKLAGDSSKSSVLYNAIELDKFYPDIVKRESVSEEFVINPTDIIVGHVGRFNVQKNHSFIIDVFYELTKMSNKYKLMLVGDGPLKTQIEDKCKKLGIYNKVIFTGVRGDVDRLMQRMDIFLFPSLYEGLGIVLIEAQVADVPSLVSCNVPKEVALSDIVFFQSLSDSPIKWKNNLLDILNRTKHHACLNINKYNIKDASNFLCRFYINCFFCSFNRSFKI